MPKGSKASDESQSPERRYVQQGMASVHVEDRAEGDPTIEGYAAVFYDGTPKTEFILWEGAIERIMPGAFDRAIEEDDVRMLFNHDPNTILGRSVADTLVLEADDVGLRYKNTPPSTTMAQDLIASIRRGDVTGSSFSFKVTDVDWREENSIEIREIRGVLLLDVGPVVYPAYEQTIATVRAVGGFVDRVLIERDAWYSQLDRQRIAHRNRARIAEIRLTRP